MKELIFALGLIVLIVTIECCKSNHPSSKYEYYEELRGEFIPTVRGRLVCGDTSFTAYMMSNTTAFIYSNAYITQDGNLVLNHGACAFIVSEYLPVFKKGEKLTEFQLKNATNNNY